MFRIRALSHEAQGHAGPSALLLLLVCAVPDLAGQSHADPRRGFTMDVWTTDHGLPQNSVNAITQTPDGYLWFGTFGGLARFDGVRFTVLTRTDSGGRHLDRILSLAAAPDSSLWIGTESGLLRYHRGRFEAFGPEHSVPARAVGALWTEPNGVVWIAGYGGMLRFANGAFRQYRVPHEIPDSALIAVRRSRSGSLWVTTALPLQLYSFQPDSTGILGPARPFPDRTLLTLEDRNNDEWFHLKNEELLRVGDVVSQQFGPRHGLRRVTQVLQDETSDYWLGNFEGGLQLFRPDAPGRKTWEFALPDGRDTYDVRAMLLDREGNLWVGTNGDGLIRVKRRLFTVLTRADGLATEQMTAVYQDPRGTLWIGTNCGGLYAMNAATLRRARWPDSDVEECIQALATDAAGTLWVGGYQGLVRRRGDRSVRVSAPGGARLGVVHALFPERDGTMWVGVGDPGDQGLLAYGRDGVRQFTRADGLPHDNVRFITRDRGGALWVGTVGGLARFADGQFTSYTTADGLSANFVRAVYQDTTGTLWIGTYGGGINRFRDGAFRAITRAQGLADDVVSSILEDDAGNLWMTGNRGIFRVSRAQLDSVAGGERARVHSLLYGRSDGLLNIETNGGFQPAAWRARDGTMWFPTVKGLAGVDPGRARTDPRAPDVYIEEIAANGEPRALDDGLRLGPGRPNLEVRYTGLSFSNPEHVVFRYRMEGFEDQWQDAGTRRVAYYPRLPPGEYRFTVSAANRDGTWNEAGAALALRVLPTVWETWWFRVAVSTLALLLVASVVGQRFAVLRHRHLTQQAFARQLIDSQESERKRIAGELHDGVGQDLLVVQNRARLALQAQDLGAGAREQLTEITGAAAAALTGVRAIARNLRPHQLDRLGLAEATRSMARSLGESSRLAVSIEVDGIDGLLPAEAEINLFRIVQESLNNVVRHARAGRAIVRIRRDIDAVRVFVSDDGVGFELVHDASGRPTGGFGISGIAERVRILGGTFELTSAVGAGTQLTVTVPAAGPAA